MAQRNSEIDDFIVVENDLWLQTGKMLKFRRSKREIDGLKKRKKKRYAYTLTREKLLT